MAIYDYVDSIKNSDDYKSLISLNKQMENELSDLINDFKIKKDTYEKIREFGKNYKGYSKVCLEYSNAKEKLFSSGIVKKYHEKEEIIKNELDELSKNLNDVMER